MRASPFHIDPYSKHFRLQPLPSSLFSNTTGRQYARKTASYIDVLGLSSVSDAVHEAARMLRIGIEHAMVHGIDGDQTVSENADRQKAQSETAPQRASHPASKEPVSVYSALSKRPRRPAPAAAEVPQQQQSSEQPEDTTTSTQRPGFAPRSWSATKKAGPSILSKRKRPNALTGKPGDKTGGLPAFQPAPKREKLSNDSTRDNVTKNVSKAVEKKPAAGQFAPQGRRETVSARTIKADVNVARASEKAVESPASTVRASSSNASKSPASSWIKLRPGPSSAAPRSTTGKMSDFARPSPPTLSPTTRKVGLPPSWCQVSTKSTFRKEAGPKPPSALAMLRRPGPSKGRELPAAPRGSSVLSSVPALKQAGTSRLVQTTLGHPVSESRGMIPLPSSTGIKVKYVPGSEIIDGVRPNGYTVSIDGVVKPVVTFNPKPKLPHKLRQTSVEKLFEAWRDNAKATEGDALARALRTEQEMYAKAKTRTDYRAAVTKKLKDLRKAEA